MRTRDLMVGTPLAKVWLTIVAACFSGLLISRLSMAPVALSASEWVQAHPLVQVLGFDPVQTAVLLCLFVALFAAYVAGQKLLRPVFVRRWAVTIFFTVLTALDWRVACWIIGGSAVVMGLAFLIVTRGLGSSLAFVPIWLRAVYAGLFVLMSWLMFGFTPASRNYPGDMTAWVSASVPQQWAFGFWVPDLAIYALIAAVALAAYVVGGYFFNYLSRHWSGPISLFVFLVSLTPWDRFQELIAVVLSSMEPVLHLLAVSLIVTVVLVVARSAASSGRQKDERPDWEKVFPYPSGIDGVPELYPDLAVPRTHMEEE